MKTISVPRAERMRESTTAKLDRLYRLHSDAGFRLALVLTGDRGRAEDLLQEAFLRVGSRLGALRDEERFRSYLCTTIVNLARTQWRRDNRRREVGPAEVAVEQPDLAARDEMLAAILRLPVKQRAVVFLRYYLDMSEADAARTLDVSLSAVKSLNHRALSGLRRELEEVRR